MYGVMHIPDMTCDLFSVSTATQKGNEITFSNIECHIRNQDDQFITNIPEFVETTEADTPLLTNDHCTVSISLRFTISKMQPVERLIWQYKHADFEGLNYALQNFDWELCFEQPNVDLACSKWNEIFLNLTRQYIPNKVVKIRTDDKP